jgi:ParB family chromosome partitioning protein
MSVSPHPAAELVEVPLDDITVAPGNHRQDLGDIDSLAESIRRIGIVQPLSVRPRDGGGYELVAGQRRLAAAAVVGLRTVPACVRSYGDTETRKAMAAENLSRKDLGALEAAAAYQELLDLGVDSDEIAALAGTSTKQVAAHTSLLALPKKVQRELHTGTINTDEALMLTQLSDTPERLTAALRNARAGWSLTAAVQHELHERELARKITASQTELEKRSVAIVERPAETFSRRAKVQRLGNGWGCIPITQAKHAKEPCHAAFIDGYSGDIVYVCTDVHRHAGVVPGIQPPEDVKAARAAKRAERVAAKQAVEARRSVLITHLKSRADTRDASTHVKRICLLETDEAAAGIACELLGITEVEDDYRGHALTLVKLVAEKPVELSRVSLAIALARAEVYAGRQYVLADEGTVVREHLRYLARSGQEWPSLSHAACPVAWH